MIKRFFECLIFIALVMFLALLQTMLVTAQADKPIKMYTTAYHYGEITASGAKVRPGICAVKKEWMGLTALVYADDNGSIGDLIGIYECLDTGFGGDADGDGIGSIENGTVIDIYQSDYESCVEWMELTGGKCWVQFVDAVG